MAQFTLDDIRAAAERKYGATIIDLGEEKVELVNALRLPKERRKALGGLQDRLEEDGADQEALLAEAVRLVAKSDAQADALLGAIGDDLALLAEIFGRYSDQEELGEASPSQS